VTPCGKHLPNFYSVYRATVREAHDEVSSLLSKVAGRSKALVIVGVGGRNYSKIISLDFGEIILYKALDIHSYARYIIRSVTHPPSSVIVSDGLDTLVARLEDWRIAFLTAALLFRHAERSGVSILAITGKDGRPAFYEYIQNYWCPTRA